MDKKAYSERDVCTKLITPALAQAGWDIQRHVREEVTFTKGEATERCCIVAKLTELLALCDQLKARIAAARAKHAQLAEALVEVAVA